jgi:hypothetical protein
LSTLPEGGSALHDETVADLCRRVREAFAVPQSWHDRIWAAGQAAMAYLRNDPQRAQRLIDGTLGGDAEAVRRRDEIVQGLADLLDGGREGGGGQPVATSRCTAEITAGAIYGALLAKIAAGAVERREDFLSELVYMAVFPYLGSRAAEDELAVQPLR